MTLSRDDETGLYHLEMNGQKVIYPSVTRIMGPLYDRKAPEYALERGRMVHRACAFMDGWGDGSGLDWASLDPVLVPYIQAYADFREITGFTHAAIETPMVCHTLRIAGTPDRSDDSRVIDLKCGGVKGWEGIQLAAYEKLLRSHWTQSAPRMIVRQSVHLFSNGTWKVETWKDPSDLRVFLALLEVENWRLRQ